MSMTSLVGLNGVCLSKTPLRPLVFSNLINCIVNRASFIDVMDNFVVTLSGIGRLTSLAASPVQIYISKRTLFPSFMVALF